MYVLRERPPGSRRPASAKASARCYGFFSGRTFGESSRGRFRLFKQIGLAGVSWFATPSAVPIAKRLHDPGQPHRATVGHAPVLLFSSGLSPSLAIIDLAAESRKKSFRRRSITRLPLGEFPFARIEKVSVSACVESV